MVDRIKPLKLESPDSGGTETDDFPTSVDNNEDFLDCRGITVQDDSSDDEAVRVSRDASGNMTFLDQANTAKTLTDLSTGGSLPSASAVGQVLMSIDGTTFSVQQPLTEYCCGWLINDFGEHLVVG